MSPMPAPIDGMATVHEALERMREEQVYSLVVKRRRPGDEYGLIVVSDIANKVIAENRSPDRVNVYEIMSKPVVTVSADMGDQVRDPAPRPLRPVARPWWSTATRQSASSR